MRVQVNVSSSSNFTDLQRLRIKVQLEYIWSVFNTISFNFDIQLLKYYQALAIVLFNPEMLGEKKYSPPFGMMKTPIEIDFNGFKGSSPIMLLVP
jgi:hypothetical protein